MCYFPAFPVYNITIGYWHIGPYTTPGITIPVPNIFGIPGWILDIFTWMLCQIGGGWEYLWSTLSKTVSGAFISGLSFLFAFLGDLFSLMNVIGSKTGIFEPIVTAFLFGLALLLIVVVLYAVVKLIIYLVELL